MKAIIKSFKLTLALCALLGLGYVFVLWAFARATSDGAIAPVGQLFSSDAYFWGRPSAAGTGYDASASGASNAAPSDSVYLVTVEARIDTFLVHHPYLKRSNVPAEMVTASASGLDPHLTPTSAYVQVRRVAAARHLPEAQVRALVDAAVERPFFFGLLGTPVVNVVRLNASLPSAPKDTRTTLSATSAYLYPQLS
ncbi:MAG: potassium-transporting ATPase subunit C [Bacteroides sp.]